VNAGETPLYFESRGQTLSGWLYLPGQKPADVGLVVCKPFGYDAICAHRSLRAFAAAGAAVGMPVLRFDYAGTGDSTDPAADADQIPLWSDDIRAAALTLRRETGVAQVCLLGLGLGALLASLAAIEAGICGLIAIAPVVGGRRYLRELRAFQAAAAKDSQAVQQNGDLEVAGFRITAASAATLNRTDLAQLSRPPAPCMLVIDRSDLPSVKPWADAMQALGAEVDYRCLPGFTDMMSTPHAAVVPREMIGATVEWLERMKRAHPPQAGLGLHGGSLLQMLTELESVAPAAPGDEPLNRVEPQTGVRWPGAWMSFTQAGTTLEERALFIDDRRVLFAVVTQAPRTQTPPPRVRRGVVLLNAGATSHIGPNRMYVTLARSWAARGFVALRLDLAGLGDSAIRPGEADNLAYPPGAVDDIATAVSFLMRQHGVTEVTLVGLCAGAYHALRAAAAGLPVKSALMINPLTFFWKEGMTMNDLQMAEVVRNPGVYREHVRSPRHWLKVIQGRVNLWRVAMIYVRRAWLLIDTGLRDLCHALRIRLPRDLRWDLETITGRGVRLVFLFARDDIGRNLLRIQGGAAIKSVGDRCRVYTIDGADHIFSQRVPRERLIQLLDRELMDPQSSDPELHTTGPQDSGRERRRPMRKPTARTRA
jgi:alpha-beta hydrolase superfamily lysophospholipase